MPTVREIVDLLIDHLATTCGTDQREIKTEMGQSRVKLSPEFEELAKDWNAEKCLRMAAHFKRFAHQLEMKGTIQVAGRGLKSYHTAKPIFLAKLNRN